MIMINDPILFNYRNIGKEDLFKIIQINSQLQNRRRARKLKILKQIYKAPNVKIPN